MQCSFANRSTIDFLFYLKTKSVIDIINYLFMKIKNKNKTLFTVNYIIKSSLFIYFNFKY